MSWINWTQTLRAILYNSRLLKHILIYFLCIVGVLELISYHIFNHTALTVPVEVMLSRPPVSCLSDSSNGSRSSHITCSQCQLSLQESDGWFCEFDQVWQRRKKLHHIQDRRNRASDERSYFFLHNWDPTIHCEFEQRIGEGGGGKWACDLHKLQLINSTAPLVYSFGSNGDFSFEKAIKQELPKSEIHTFDQNVHVCPANVCKFHQTYVGDGKHDGSKSLQMILNDLNHQGRDIDILKVDIEGGEFPLFTELFKLKTISNNVAHLFASKRSPYIRQILVEIHLQYKGEAESRRAHALFERFRQNNYAIFHKEANINECQNVFEYAFIRLNSAFFITPGPSSLQ